MALYTFKEKKLPDFGIYPPIQEGENMKIKVNKAIKLADGKHTGTLKSIEYRAEPYSYVDFTIEESDTKFALRCGVPAYISENSALGMILMNFGCPLSKFVDKELDIEDFITAGKKVSFITTTDGKYQKIQPSSIDPL